MTTVSSINRIRKRFLSFRFISERSLESVINGSSVRLEEKGNNEQENSPKMKYHQDVGVEWKIPSSPFLPLICKFRIVKRSIQPMLYLNENTIHFQRFPGKIISTISYYIYFNLSIRKRQKIERWMNLWKGKPETGGGKNSPGGGGTAVTEYINSFFCPFPSIRQYASATHIIISGRDGKGHRKKGRKNIIDSARGTYRRRFPRRRLIWSGHQ